MGDFDPLDVLKDSEKGTAVEDTNENTELTQNGGPGSKYAMSHYENPAFWLNEHWPENSEPPAGHDDGGEVATSSNSVPSPPSPSTSAPTTTVTSQPLPAKAVANHLVFDIGQRTRRTVSPGTGKLWRYYSTMTPHQRSNFVRNIYNTVSSNKILATYYSSTRKRPDQPSAVINMTPKVIELNDQMMKSLTLGRDQIAYIQSNKQGNTLRRSIIRQDTRQHIAQDQRKESNISFFEIEIDRVSSYQYRPGEEISGAINIVIRQSVEIRFVELIVLGKGVITVRKARDGFPKSLNETYLHKQKYVMGSGDANWNSILSAGHYTSKFRVRLPQDLPSTIHHDDTTQGLKFDITYTLKARICDNAGVRVSTRSTSSRMHKQTFLRVLASKQVRFNVQRSFDLSMIPDAHSPVSHSEQIYLACSHQEPSVISLSVDRGVFLAGDDIRMQLQVHLPSSQKVKDISCSLLLHVTMDAKKEPLVFTLSRIFRKDPNSQVHRKQQALPGGIAPGVGRGTAQEQRQDGDSGYSLEEQNMFDLTLPTPTNLLSQYSLGGSQVKVEYSLAVSLKFSPAGGKLAFKVPVGIGPCAEPIYTEKLFSRKAVPLFNRPTRFPYFSSSQRPSSPKSTSLPETIQSTSSIQVKSKYSNSCWARCFLCCSGMMDD